MHTAGVVGGREVDWKCQRRLVVVGRFVYRVPHWGVIVFG
jgi:hypothetical protein